MSKSKILIIVEGAKTDFNLMNRVLKLYGISDTHQVVSYNTNIYTLYNQLPDEYDRYEDFDLLQLIKEREKNPEKRALLSEHYSDILLIFDLDPHAPDFTFEKISRMVNYFTESTDMGKLYLNYPMVEAFYHMTDIPDYNYSSYYVTMEDLVNKKYKNIVHNICRDGDYSKFAKTKEECNIVIKQNLDKMRRLVGDVSDSEPSQIAILNSQLELLKTKNIVSVLCTCIFYITDYNGNLLL